MISSFYGTYVSPLCHSTHRMLIDPWSYYCLLTLLSCSRPLRCSGSIVWPPSYFLSRRRCDFSVSGTIYRRQLARVGVIPQSDYHLSNRIRQFSQDLQRHLAKLQQDEE